MSTDRPYLLDVTRLVAGGWANRKSTGIDRVCEAYARHFGSRSHAVIQHRGVVRVLSATKSDYLFELLDRREGFRSRLARLATSILINDQSQAQYSGKIYLNVGHTDFDLSHHWRWVRRARLKSIYFIHDLIPITRPELTHPKAVARHSGRVKGALLHAHGIIVNSEATSRDLRQFASNHAMELPSVVSSHLGVDHLIQPTTTPSASGRHFACLSTVEPRKNHLLLLRVWNRIIERCGGNGPMLVLIGRWGFQAKSVRTMLRINPVLARHVTVLDDCGDADMAQWIHSAHAVLLPSMAEGYGLPLAEAMAMGTPVISSDLPCFSEIGNGIPLQIQADDEAAWEAAVIDFLHSDIEANRQRDLLARHRPARWAEHFRIVDDWIPGVVAKQPCHPDGAVLSEAT